MLLKDSILTWQRVPASDIRFKKLEEEISFHLEYAIIYEVLKYGIGVLIRYFPMP
jgi:hypothetical protein